MTSISLRHLLWNECASAPLRARPPAHPPARSPARPLTRSVRPVECGRFDAVNAFLLAVRAQLAKMQPTRCNTFLGECPTEKETSTSSQTAVSLGEVLQRTASESPPDYHDPALQRDTVIAHIDALVTGGASYFERLWCGCGGGDVARCSKCGAHDTGGRSRRFVIGILYALPETWDLIKTATEAGVFARFHEGFHEFIDESLAGTFSAGDADDSATATIEKAALHPLQICLACLDRFQETIENPATHAI